MTFGEKLQKLRAREGLSQDALAELLNVSRQAVSRWERDETMPETEKVVRISDHFHVTTDYLLKDGPEHFPPSSRPLPDPEHFPPSSRPLPDPGELWRKYGFLLAWAAALWGVTLCLRMLPMAAMALGEGEWLLSLHMSLLWLSPGASVTAAGVLWARRWQRRGRFRRQDLGRALALGGGVMTSAWLLAVLVDWIRTSCSTDYVLYSLRSVRWPALTLLLGLLLALLPSRSQPTP